MGMSIVGNISEQVCLSFIGLFCDWLYVTLEEGLQELKQTMHSFVNMPIVVMLSILNCNNITA